MIQPEYYAQIPHDYYVPSEKKGHLCAGKNLRIFSRRLISPTRSQTTPAVLVALMLLSLAASLRASNVRPATQPTSMEERVGRLIDQLRSDDAGVRQSAAATLTALGAAARPAILKLTKSDDPGLRQQADQILLNLPWYLPGDPPEVKALLLHYNTPDIGSRCDVVRELSVEKQVGIDALLRLLEEDPSPAVQWTVVASLREQDDLDRCRAVQPIADNSRVLALCGYAQLLADVPTGINDLRECARLEFANPTDDDGEFDFVIRFLADEACLRRQFDEAADWRRKELARGSEPDQSGVPTALLELFVLHADFGPLKGFNDDLALAGKDAHKPKILYALARMYARMHDAAEADAHRQAAFHASSTRSQRYDIGEFLCDHGWDDLAEGELEEFLKLGPPGRAMEPRYNEANVHFHLAGIAVKRGDDKTAAQQKEQAMLILGALSDLPMSDSEGHHFTIPASEIWAEIYWRYSRAAIAEHDEVQVQRRLEQLLELKPTNSDIAIDVVPLLEQRGRAVDANLLFQWAFQNMKTKLDADPQNPDTLNGLAWLCAKCNRNLPDALRWAKQAAALTPTNAAVLDTLAEVNFRIGRPDVALRLETQAVRLEPDDPFMQQQIERFRAAAGGPATRPN
jgi:tetratricopeptide (TPR) repeat protein